MTKLSMGIGEDGAMAEVLEQEIATFEREKERLQKEHTGKFVLVFGDAVIDTFDTFDSASAEGLRQFGQGPFLIRQVGRANLDISVALLHGLNDAYTHRRVSVE